MRQGLRVPILLVVALVGVMSFSGGALAEPDPTSTTDAPPTTTTPPPTTQPPSPPPTTEPPSPTAPPPGPSAESQPPPAPATPRADAPGTPAPRIAAAEAPVAAADATAPPSISKAFGAPVITVGGTTSLSFTITNPNAAASLSGVGFTDILPAGLQVSSPNGLTGSCGGGTITAVASTSAISLSGATLAPSAVCSFSVNVTATTAGSKNNTSGPVTSIEGGNGNAAQANTIVLAPPNASKAFTPASVVAGGTTSLTITITNPNGLALNGISFTDAFPAGMTVAAPSNANGTCGGTISAVPGSTSVSLSGGLVLANSSCTVSVNVTVTAAGVYNNSTGPVTSANGGTNPSGGSAALTVLPSAADLEVTKSDAPDPVQAGANLTYTITVTNNGPATAQNVTMSDPIPAGTTFVSLTQGPGPAFACTNPSPGGTGTVNCSVTTLAGGASKTFTLVVKVNSSPGAGTLTNTASVGASTPDPSPGNNSAT